MIRLIVLLAFVAFLAFSPVFLLDTYVMPQMTSLKSVYANSEDSAAKITTQQ